MSSSLFSRLLLTLIASLTVLWLATAGVAAWRTHLEAGKLHDRHLAQTAQVLLAIAGQEIAEHLHSPALAVTPESAASGGHGLSDLAAHLATYAPPDALAFQVHARDGLFRFRSENFPDGLDDAGSVDGYADQEFAGLAWRVYTRRDAARLVTVQVAQRSSERRQIATAMIGAVVLPLIAGLVLAAALAHFHVRRARRPLEALASALERRSADQLEPLSVHRPPRELEPIVRALNRLMALLRTRMESERRFTGDAAHELRTPLAALRTDAEMALESDGERRETALRRLRNGTERASRLVDQMLTLARLDPVDGLAEPEPVDLGASAQEVLSHLAQEARRRCVRIGLEEHGRAQALGDPALVHVLVRNLVENAIRHTPAEGRVDVLTSMLEGEACLRVTDTGPGIPPAERARAFERFYKVSGTRTTGSGLGLSIAARIVALHGARITLDSGDPGGLEVTVRFPAPSPPAPADPVAAHHERGPGSSSAAVPYGRRRTISSPHQSFYAGSWRRPRT